MGIFCSRNNQVVDTHLKTEKSVIKKDSPLAKQKMDIPQISQTISSSSPRLPHPNAITNTPQNSGRAIEHSGRIHSEHAHSYTNLYLSPNRATIVYYVPKELQ